MMRLAWEVRSNREYQMSKPNNIFISWSGERSKWVAEALKDWLPNVLQAARPWLSTRDIEKGTRGLTEMNKALGGMGFGICCLTSENLESEWILFEAGALSKTFDDDKARLWTYLLGGLQHQDVKPPLGQFQHTKAEKKDTRKLIHSINNAINSEEDRLKETAVNDAFDRWWPDFQKTLETIPSAKGPAKEKRGSDEIMTEILEMCRRYLPQLGELDDTTRSFPNLTLPGFTGPSTLVAATPTTVMNPFGTPVAPYRGTYHVKLQNDEEIKVIEGTRHSTEFGGLIIADGGEIVARFTEPIENWWKE